MYAIPRMLQSKAESLQVATLGSLSLYLFAKSIVWTFQTLFDFASTRSETQIACSAAVGEAILEKSHKGATLKKYSKMHNKTAASVVEFQMSLILAAPRLRKQFRRSMQPLRTVMLCQL
jgi:hypothetical protein